MIIPNDEPASSIAGNQDSPETKKYIKNQSNINLDKTKSFQMSIMIDAVWSCNIVMGLF